MSRIEEAWKRTNATRDPGRRSGTVSLSGATNPAAGQPILDRYRSERSEESQPEAPVSPAPAGVG